MNEFSLATTTPEEQTAPLTVINDDEGINFVVDLTSRQTSYCSMIAETVEEKAKLYNATNSTEYRIKDHINEVLEVKDVFVEVVKCTNQETGEVSTCPRTVLIDVNGNGYQAVSLGIFSALKKLFNIFGEPRDWEAPLKLKIRQISHGTRNILTFDIVS